MKISEMRNLGPASEKSLNKIGIYTSSDLERVGPNLAFKKMKDVGLNPHTCFLYAMIGAIEDISWIQIARMMKVNNVEF